MYTNYLEEYDHNRQNTHPYSACSILTDIGNYNVPYDRKIASFGTVKRAHNLDLTGRWVLINWGKLHRGGDGSPEIRNITRSYLVTREGYPRHGIKGNPDQGNRIR